MTTRPILLLWTLLASGAAHAATLPPADQAAAMRAAGMTQANGRWGTADCREMQSASYTPAEVQDARDLNGDSRPEALIVEGSTICYGMSGQAYWLMTKGADGRWTQVTQGIGMPNFLATRGPGGWPDIEIGGPGFCFPVVRWNGSAYALNRQQYEGRPCRR
jgi:hypothetical protein